MTRQESTQEEPKAPSSTCCNIQPLGPKVAQPSAQGGGLSRGQHWAPMFLGLTAHTQKPLLFSSTPAPYQHPYSELTPDSALGSRDSLSGHWSLQRHRAASHSFSTATDQGVMG